jgi:hypothetical protein
MTRRWDVDHFLPWSRHPDNTLDNLVAAHAVCNGAKSASLAAVIHLDRWIKRFLLLPASEALDAVATAADWPRRSDRVLSTARAIYLWLPEGTRLWRQASEYEPLQQTDVRAIFASVA